MRCTSSPMDRFCLVILSTLCCISSSAVSSGQPKLPFGDVNVVVVTDVHSHVGGHKETDPNSADYGDLLAFVEHLKAYAEELDLDIWFVMNGDWIDGTGIALNGDPSHLIPILEKMPFDAVNVGNHELYDASVIEYARRPGGLVEWFGKKYLSSNVLSTDSMHPIGYQYRILRGKHSNVLTFGFLFNMKDHSPIVTVQDVEVTVKQKWFKAAVTDTDSYDAIMVLAHMDVRDRLCDVILQEIRHLAGESVPVQFISGHTHHRDTEMLDDWSSSFEAGRYFDTIGFASFPSKRAKSAAPEIASSLTDANSNETFSPFKYDFIEPTVENLADKLSISPQSLPTGRGVELSQFILRVHNDLALTEVIGCAAGNLYFERSLDAGDSLWGFFVNKIVPSQLSKHEVIFIGNGAWRYDLLKGDVRRNDIFSVSPFNNSFWVWENVPAEVIALLNATMNEDVSWKPYLPGYVLASPEPFEPQGRAYNLLVDAFEKETIGEQLEIAYPNATARLQPKKIDTTTSTIWMDYFKTYSHNCKQAKANQKHKPKKQTSLSNNIGGFATSNPEADTVRLAFVACSVLVMGVLGSVAVWQKGDYFRDLTAAREFETLQAIREYYDDDFSQAGGRDVEGEFV